MKIVLIFAFLFNGSLAYSQDTLKIKQIDAIVDSINGLALSIQRDTIIQDIPEIGINASTFLEMIVSDGALLKFVNNVNTTSLENGAKKLLTTSSSFYFSKNKLIKVEEYGIEAGKRKNADWYYSDEKPLYYTFVSERSEERANLLITISKEMLKRVIK